MKPVLIVKVFEDEKMQAKAMRKARYAPSIANAAMILDRDPSTVSRAVSGDRGVFRTNGYFVIAI